MKFYSTIRFKLTFYAMLSVSFLMVFSLALELWGIPFTGIEGDIVRYQNDALNRMDVIATLAENQLRTWVSERRTDLRSISNGNEFRQAFERILNNENEGIEQIEPYVRALTNGSENWNSLYLFDLNGNNLYASSDFIPLDILSRFSRIFNTLISQGWHVESGPLIDNRGQVYFYQNQIVNGSFKGFIAASANMAPLFREFNVIGGRIGSSGEIIVVDQDRVFLLADEQYIGTQGNSTEIIYAANAQGGRYLIEDYLGNPVATAIKHFRPTASIGWGVIVKQNQAEIFNDVRETILFRLISLLVLLLIFFFLNMRITSISLASLYNLRSVAEKISKGNISIRANENSGDEVSDLAAAFNKMVISLVISQSELADQLEIIKRSQHQLVESEKMAALGGLVGGIAHELNTPLGVGVTAITFLETEYREMREIIRTLKSDSDSKDALSKKDKNVLESIEIVLKNIQRAAGLISSFKRIAIDQSMEQVCSFNLHSYLEDIIKSLNPIIKKSRIQVNLNCPVEYEMTSYPGSFSQVFTNLISNSAMHGFIDREAPQISIDIENTGDSFLFTYRDNGLGMSDEVMEHIYEPFFTTARNRGGSGLGMNLVYNLINQKLKGSISLKSGINEGVEFLIEIPHRITQTH
jgi:signal transduction histidine kinase